MRNAVLILILISLGLPFKAKTQQVSLPAGIPGYNFYPPQQDRDSWKRLYLLQSTTFLVVAKEGQGDLDSCLLASSRTRGISRYYLIAEGMNDPALQEEAKWIDHDAPAEGIRHLSTATGKKRLELLVLLGGYYAFRPHNYALYLDSVEYFLGKAITESKQLKEDKLRRLALCHLVKTYSQGNDRRTDSVSNLLVSECQNAGDGNTEARMLAYRSKYTPPMPETLQRKAADVRQAADIYQRVRNTEGQIDALTDLGYLQIIFGQLDSSYQHLLKALSLAESIHYPYIHYNTQALATVTSFQGKFGEPLRYVYQTIRTSEATRDSLAWAYFYTGMATLFDAEARYRESAEWALKSVTRFVADGNTSVYPILLTLVANLITEEKRMPEAITLARDVISKIGLNGTFSEKFSYHELLANIYTTQDSLDLAAHHIKKMDELETEAAVFRGPMRRSDVTMRYAFLELARKRYQAARDSFNVLINTPGVLDKMVATKRTVYFWMIYIDSALGDHAAAVEHYKRYTRILDSSFTATKVRQAEELQVIYQMTEKEAQIQSLTQQKELQEANSEKSAWIRNLAIAGTIAVLIIAGLLYRQNRLRRKNNEVVTRQNTQLQQLVADKEWLLKEVHHRVKNNLQIVMSLLDSQSIYINNDEALTAIHDSLHRVHAMALIHQKLYQSDDVASIAMPEYTDDLVSYARESFDTGNRIRFQQSVEPLNLDVSQAILLGLIINECIVNAIKYAFPEGRKGIVSISLAHDHDHHLVLKIADNGVGLPDGFELKENNSLGLDLIRGLTRQLNGKISFDNVTGLRISIRFPVTNSYVESQTDINAH